MKSKAAIATVATVATLALVLLLAPSAWAKAKWSYGNGRSDLAVDTVASGPTGQGVCSGHVTGFAGLGTSIDPSVTPPPPIPDQGLTVELYAGADLGGAEHAPGSGKLTFPDFIGYPDLLPIATVTTATPTALDPPDEYTGFSPDDKIWEYAAAPFSFDLPTPMPVGSQVVIVLSSNTAYVQTVALNCTTTALVSSSNPSSPGESVTFTATVTGGNGAPVSSKGTVTFVVDSGAATYGPVAVDASGQARVTTSVLSAGPHQVVAEFVGGSFDLLGSSSDSLTQTVQASTDSTPPTFGPCTGGPFLFRTGDKTVSVTAADEAGGSGLDAAASTLTGTVRTGTVGVKKVTFTATDNAGNSATKTCRYRVKYVFSGFTPPVDNALLNVAAAGLAVPFRFTVTDGKGLPVTDLTSAWKTSDRHACRAGTTDAIEEYTSGPAGLQNLGGGAYQFNVTTSSAWAWTCRTLGIVLGDGVAHRAQFKFRP